MNKKEDKPSKTIVFSGLEAATLCGVVNQTALNWIRAGYLKAFQTPGGQFRIYPEDLADFMEKRGIEIPPDLQKILDAKKAEQKKKTFLIVDDDKAFNKVTCEYLQKNLVDVEIFQAYDGFEAGSLFSKEKPQLVILDLNLPGVDGIEVCRKIRQADGENKTDVIIITAMEDEESQAKCQELGVASYIHKPVNLTNLLEIIKKLDSGLSSR